MQHDTIAMTGLEMACMGRWGRFNTQGLYTDPETYVGEVWDRVSPIAEDNEIAVVLYGRVC